MKRPIFTLNNFLNIFSVKFQAIARAFSIVLTFTLIQTNIQAQCDVILACNDGVQISLDDDCNMTIEPDMILEAPDYGDIYYDVEAKLPNGTSLPLVTGLGNHVGFDGISRPIKRVAINSSHIGVTLQVKVSLRGCGNSCWGDATIEDKLKPVVATCPCEPRITEFTGIIYGSTPTYERPQGSICTGGAGSFTTTDYTVFQFAVQATGVVNINLGQTSAMFNLYSGSFNPSTPCNNLVSNGINTRTFSGNLMAGTNYFLVVSSIGNLSAASNVIVNSLTIGSPTTEIKSSVSGSICIFECNQESNILGQTAANATSRPTFSDACGGTLTYSKVDSVTNLSCNDPYSKIIKRYWTAKDASGNTSDTKVQYFYIERLSIADVSCPADWIMECSTPFAKLPNGAPTPAVSGQPQIMGCQNVQMYYDDVVFDLCGPGIKVLRQWTILDWCSGEDKVCSQTIKVEDTFAPLIDVAQPFKSPICFYGPGEMGALGSPKPSVQILSTDANTCLGKPWTIAKPSLLSDACSAPSTLSWYVKFKKGNGSCLDPDEVLPFITSDATTSVLGTPGASNYRIEGLPLGRTWIRYYALDECGNERTVTVEIDVVDLTPPTAICEDQTVVSLDDSGWAELYAESLDDHSTDNCGPITKYEIKRKTTTCAGYAADLNFGPKVRFCCADVTAPVSYVEVVLRVYDAAGNYNECETTVKVQNKRAPAIICPGDKTLICNDAKIAAWATENTRFDTVFFGKPSVSGICSDLKFGSRIISNTINAKCGTGVITKEWFLLSNPSMKCSQKLTVTSPAFSSSMVVFPGTITLPTCDIDKATPEILNSKPIVTNTSCRDIGISFTDQVFPNVSEACIKILRTWRVIDWCTYQGSQVVAEQVQTIKLTGSGAATFTGCSPQVHVADPAKCDKEVTLSANATDDCTDPEDLKYTWSLDLDKNGSTDFSGTGKSFTRVLPKGIHKVTFTVINRCGTPTSCMYEVTIQATKKPTPVCLREVVWVMDPSRMTEIWASDFNLKSENNCGDDSKLKFSFNAEGTQLSRKFTCADIPNGQVARIPLKMYAIDESGNFDFCEVTLILQDSPLTNACTDNPTLLPTVAGRIATETNEGIDNIEVGLTNMVSTTELKEMTQNHGEYKFKGVDVFDPKTIGAYKNTDILNGVSTLDLVLIQRHILGVQKIESPYKLLAADVNNSRTITASDLVNLRKLILGITLDFENNTSWRFVPTQYVFQDATYPFDFPSKINLDSIFEDKSNVNFTAIKVGDVNSSAIANINQSSTERRASNALFVADKKGFEAGKLVKYEIKAGDAMEIMGGQFALQFDADKLSFSGIKGGAFDIKSQHFNALHAANGQLSFSFDAPEGISLKADDVLFTIEFKSSASGNTTSVKLDPSGISAEIYEMDASVRAMHLQSRDKNAETGNNVLYQNEPNPFKDYTNISFEISKSTDVIVRVMDVTGKVVFTQNGWFEKGYNTISVSNHQLSRSGVYYYQIEANEFSATKKMILIE